MKLSNSSNQTLTEELYSVKQQLFSVDKELLEKTKLAIYQKKKIGDLEMQTQNLEESLNTAFEDIRKLHLSLEEAKRAEELASLPPVKKNDEIDLKLREIMIKTRVPVKFIRIGEGLYIFGSKRVHVKILNGKLVIRIGGGYMYVEEFIRLYAHQELVKLKNKEEAQASEQESEENAAEPRSLQNITEDSHSSDHFLREIEQLKANETRASQNRDITPGKKASLAEKILAPENLPRLTPEIVKPSMFNDAGPDVNNENAIYEITPRGAHTLKGSRAKTPDLKAHFSQYDTNPTNKFVDNDGLKSTKATDSAMSYRENQALHRLGYTRR